MKKYIVHLALIGIFISVLVAGCQSASSLPREQEVDSPQLSTSTSGQNSHEMQLPMPEHDRGMLTLPPTLSHSEHSEFITIRGIEYSTSLTSLDLNHGIFEFTNEDIVALQYMVNLTELTLRGNEITDISSLSNLTLLEVLVISNTSVEDISPLSALTNLNVLKLNHNRISNLSPLAALTNLRELELISEAIADISPLSSLENLEYLVLSFNQISDISPLRQLPNLSSLCLLDNPITDWSPVAHIENVSGRP